MFLGIFSRLVPLEPIVFFSSMAGVMTPMVMVVAGALALWASHNPGLFEERPRLPAYKAVLPSLVAGLMIVTGTAILFLVALAMLPEGIFPAEGLRLYFNGIGANGYPGLAVLLAAYVALAVIGGVLYGIVVPEEPAR